MSGRSPKVSWQESQSTGKIRNGGLAGWFPALYILYAAALGMLLFYAALRMAEDCFGSLLGAEKPGCLWAALAIIPVTLAWNEALYALGKPGLRLGGSLIPAMAVLGGFWYWYRDLAKEVVRGFYGLGQRYLDAWNRYFLTSLKINPALVGKEAQQQLAWGLLFAVTAVLLQSLSALLRKRSVLLLLPAAILTAEMTVGLTPEWPGMACMFAAGMLGLYLDRHKEFQAVPALVLALLLAVLLPLTAVVLKEPASRVSLAHDRLQAFQHGIEKEIRDYDWQALFALRRDGRLSNQRPEYRQEEVLTVTVSERPDSCMYLRGYFGAEYQKGYWDTPKGEFDSACRRYGIEGGEAALLLAGLNNPARAFGSADRVQYGLQYTGRRSSSAYLPYGADLETVQDQCRTSGDYLVVKAKSLKSLVFEGYAPGSLVLNDPALWNSDVQSFYSWYNEYVVEHYLAVPEGLAELTETVRSISGTNACQTAREGLTDGDVNRQNEARVLLGNLVARELQSRARYNIDPGSLPRGTDPVEYFLGENRQGYCMHFATAGALILRQLGVPARFVSGYVAQPGQFRRTSEGYRASVKDEDAHAWVEIWLEQVGWVPVEMTPGYGEAVSVLTAHGQQDSPEPSQIGDMPDGREQQQGLYEEMNRQEAAPLPSPSSLPQNPFGETDPGTAGEGALAQGLDGLDSSEGQDGWGFAGEGGWAIFGRGGSLEVEHVVWALLGLLGAAGLVWLGAFLLLRRRAVWWEKVRADIENGSTRSAVRIINRKLYRRLKRQRAGILILRSDQEYLAALEQQYPWVAQKDWEGYLEVVQKAAYSREEIGLEQARECYMLLKRTGAKAARFSHKKLKK